MVLIRALIFILEPLKTRLSSIVSKPIKVVVVVIVGSVEKKLGKNIFWSRFFNLIF